MLNIINDVNQTLPKVLEEFGVASEATLEEWLAEEKVYLQSLGHEPLEETLKMEYLHRLVKLSGSQYAHHCQLVANAYVDLGV